MSFSSPTMMIGANQNSENVDRLNLVLLSFSLHCIPTTLTVFFLGKNSPVSQLLHMGRPFDLMDNLSNQIADFETRKKIRVKS
jgi:hypothetical protein